MKNQYEQEISGQYQGHWQDVQQVPKYFQTRDSQATLQGIMVSHGEDAKLRCPQLHIQAKNYQLLGK